jgi:hypothetical protein
MEKLKGFYLSPLGYHQNGEVSIRCVKAARNHARFSGIMIDRPTIQTPAAFLKAANRV